MDPVDVGKHSRSDEPDGYVTAFDGDLNPDLPTGNFLRPVLDESPPERWADETLELLQRVKDGLERL